MGVELTLREEEDQYRLSIKGITPTFLLTREDCKTLEDMFGKKGDYGEKLSAGEPVSCTRADLTLTIKPILRQEIEVEPKAELRNYWLVVEHPAGEEYSSRMANYKVDKTTLSDICKLFSV